MYLLEGVETTSRYTMRLEAVAGAAATAVHMRHTDGGVPVPVAGRRSSCDWGVWPSRCTGKRRGLGVGHRKQC